ncbi:adenine phosphoribosyltransferase [Pseudomonas sp. F1_0610]|uniref:adenine phosphoribosyltransferase n=1 Tax=Pseudomonas sp. F1_0610 TaxID=3114284 RepID=UPI0039C45BB3
MIFDEFAVKSCIRPVKDFPKKGVIFRDITPIFLNPKALRMVVDCFVQRYMDSPITHIGALDARGFLIGSTLAYELNKPLVLFRKKGKLPANVIAESYETEYGQSTIEIQADSLQPGDQMLLLDDLIATGGTFLAAARLVRRLGAQVYEAAAIVDLPELNGSKLLQEMDVPTYCLTAFTLDEY